MTSSSFPTRVVTQSQLLWNRTSYIVEPTELYLAMHICYAEQLLCIPHVARCPHEWIHIVTCIEDCRIDSLSSVEYGAPPPLERVPIYYDGSSRFRRMHILPIQKTSFVHS